MRRGRSPVGKVLALLVMGALLVPSILGAKTTKRTARPGPKRETQIGTRPASATKETAVRSGSVRRAARSNRRAHRGLRGSVDEHIHVRRGDTVENILSVRGVGVLDSREWLGAAEDVYDLRKIRPRHGLTLRFDRETRALESIRYEIDSKRLLVVESSGDGIAARLEDLPYFIEVRGLAGRIDHGLREDTKAAGVPAGVAAALADIFGWDVDVETGLHAGDEFRVIYENIWQVGGTTAQAGKVLAAELVVDGKRETAMLFEDEDGHGGYYRPSGEALSRSFLRYPVEFNEISSEFTLERFHPIRREWRPHLGVDLAAPSGTPVRATSDGVVSESGWESGLGQTVRLDHANAVASAYGHLSAIAPGIRPGATIERGQVLGFVGSTGLSTGPHLHYELTRGGEHVDPMTFTADREPSIAPALARQFERTKREAVKQLTALPANLQATSVSLSTSVFQATE